MEGGGCGGPLSKARRAVHRSIVRRRGVFSSSVDALTILLSLRAFLPVVGTVVPSMLRCFLPAAPVEDEPLQLLALPDELLALIISAAGDSSPASLARLSTVCRQLRFLVDSLILPRLPRLVVSGRPSNAALAWAARRCRVLTHLHVHDCGACDSALGSLLAVSPLLVSLQLVRLRHVTNDALRFFNGTELLSLSLSGCRKLGDSALVHLFLRCGQPRLRSLNLDDTAVSDSSLPLLARCALLAASLSYRSEPVGFSFLASSTCASHDRTCRSLTHAGLASWLSTATPGLQRLRLAHRKAILQADLMQLLDSHAHSLTHLDLRSCCVEGESLLLCLAAAPCAPRLTALLLGSPAHGGVASAEACAALALRCVHLEVLDFSNWRLNYVSLGELGRLAHLRELTLVRCSCTAQGLGRLLSCCARLERLVCVRCVGERAMCDLAKRHARVSVVWSELPEDSGADSDDWLLIAD